MSTITQSITQLGPLPTRAVPIDFIPRGQALLEALDDLVSEFGTWASQANALSSQVSGFAQVCQTARAAATTSLQTLTASGLTVYAASSTYSSPALVLGSDGVVYRCLGSGIVGDDPVGSVTGNWLGITADPLATVGVLSAGGLVPGWDWQAQDTDGTYPPTSPATPDQVVCSRGTARLRFAYTWGPGGRLEVVSIHASGNEGTTWTPVAALNDQTITYLSGAAVAGAWS